MTKHFDTLSVGSATLDIFLKSNDFQVMEDAEGVEQLCLRYGTKVDVHDFALQSGGGATNTAVGLSRLGFSATVIAEMGVDLAANVVIEDLKKEKVDTSFLVQEEKENTGISSLLISAQGGRSVVTARGAAQMLTKKDIPLEQIQCHWIHMSSIGNIGVIQTLAAHAKKNRIRFSWNPGSAELKALQSGELHIHEVFPTVFCVNSEEAELLTKAGYDMETAGTTVIITDGRKGGKFFEHGKWHTYEPAPLKKDQVVQETGAGDAFITGVIGAYLSDRQTPAAILWGVHNAGSVVQHMGAKTGLLTREAIEKL